MWSFFSSDPSKNFPYEIGEKVTGQEDKSIWSLHRGKHKTKGNPVSIFVFDTKSSSESQIQVAKASFKKIKTLRHPNILSYVDGLETEKVLYVVTEAVVPLDNYLHEFTSSGKELAISWGLHQIAKGLSFLINDCGFIHNNVCISSVYVDQSGEWRLGGVDYMFPATGPESIPPVKILPALERYDPPEKSRGGGKKAGEKWSTDSWGLGCLIWEIFNGSLQRPTTLKSLGKIPKSLIANYCQMVSADPCSRPNPAAFITNCCHQSGFMDNKFVQTMLFLEEIQIKDQNEKTSFFNSLPPVLDSFPAQFCKLRILPQLLHAFEYGNAGSAVLTPLFKIGKNLNAEDYQSKIVPCIVKLFASTDRATRVKLLQQMGDFVEFLSPQIINDKIFPNVVQGFLDTNPMVREHTIKSMLYMASKLNYKNLNEELLKHFARLQSKDDQGGIRTNTTVCLGKIACYLNPQIRQKCLSSAYLRAVKDPFPPSRQAGVLALAATHNFFTLKESAMRLLPTLCSLTTDPDKGVRDQAFKAIRCYIGKLEKVSENPELAEEMEKDVNTGGSPASNAASWAGWAVSGVSSITSKIYTGKKQTEQARIGNLPKSPPKSAKSSAQPASKSKQTVEQDEQEQEEEVYEEEQEQHEEETEQKSKPSDGWDSSGWDDSENWGNMEDNEQSTSEQAANTDGWNDGGGGDDEDDWGAIEDTNTDSKKSIYVEGEDESSPWGSAGFAAVSDDTSQATSTYDWGGDPNSDDFFSTLISDKKPTSSSQRTTSSSQRTPSSSQRTTSSSRPTSASSKQSLIKPSKPATRGDAGWKESQWDDSSGWDDDWASENKSEPGMSKADEAKRLREEKRAQRQKEIEQKRAARASSSGAMKLGTKKMAAD